MSAVIMDIKTFLDNIYENLCCPVCYNRFTNPKLLPCLHSFCLHCLQRIQATSGTRDTILCPECRRSVTILGNGDLNTLPTNFRLNGLLDALPVTECKTSGVKCGNCNKRRQESAYCFTCCSFWCHDCLPLHNGIKTFKEHHALALKDFGDEDFENIFRQPTFCPKHEKKELELFCRVCKTTICNSCALIDHEGHDKIALDDAAKEHRLRINTAIESKKGKAQKKVRRIAKLGENCTQVQEDAERVKSEVQQFTYNLIAAIETKKNKIFDEVEKKAKQCLEQLGDKSQQIEEEMKRDQIAIEKCYKMLKRSTNAQIMQQNEFLDQLFREESEQEDAVDHDGENVIDFAFKENEELFSELFNEFKPRLFKPVLSFGKKGSAPGKFNWPWGIAVNDKDEIAVTDNGNHRIQTFLGDGTHLRSFGREGNLQGQFNYPSGITFYNDNIIVSDSVNHRIQIFDDQGHYLHHFGEKGKLSHQLDLPIGLSIDSDGNIIVADANNKSIKIFTLDGQFLRTIGDEGSFIDPVHCIQHNHYFIVSDSGDHCIKVFDKQGKFLYNFGMKGAGDGEFNPHCLSVDKGGHLLVCDAKNGRVQVFKLNGEFRTKFGAPGKGKGKFSFPISTAFLSDGRIIVTEFGNDRVQVFE